jgi:hypothetical protein
MRFPDSSSTRAKASRIEQEFSRPPRLDSPARGAVDPLDQERVVAVVLCAHLLPLWPKSGGPPLELHLT